MCNVQLDSSLGIRTERQDGMTRIFAYFFSKEVRVIRL